MNRRPLDAAELADAAMSAALAVGLLTIGRVLAAGTFFQVLATVVWAVLAARRRRRTVISGTVASMSLALLLGGIGPVSQAFVAGLFGGAAGPGLRHRHGRIRHVVATAAIAWPVVATATVGFLALFAETRRLSFENGRNQWLGAARLIRQVGLDDLADNGTRFVDWSLDHWWLMVPALQLVISLGYALVVRRLGSLVLSRVDRALGPARSAPAAHDDAPDPVPLHLGEVVVRQDAKSLIVGNLGITIAAGDGVVVAGRNGIGKSSLFDAIAGLSPSTGITRPGPIGLGQVGGTALIGQRPETQVVGIRVIDDARWGLPDGTEVESVLRAVGLEHRRQTATADLSGGELQRLAIAGALLRRPALLLSDESTSMLDPQGRAAVGRLLVEATDAGTAVLHATHLRDESDLLPRRLALAETKGASAKIDAWSPRRTVGGAIRLEADGVGHVASEGSPWAQRVLTGIDLTVRVGELALVVGPNGSGKTTFARILAGLLVPTEGEVRLAGAALRGPNPRVGIAFQHARLQLLRPTVGAEVASLAGRPEVADALRAVGFDPSTIAARRIDELSGGETRRVLLAGLIARQCDVVLLDEPLAGLDEEGRHQLTNAVDLLLGRGAAVVVVSHDPSWATGRADTVLVLS